MALHQDKIQVMAFNVEKHPGKVCALAFALGVPFGTLTSEDVSKPNNEQTKIRTIQDEATQKPDVLAKMKKEIHKKDSK